VSLEKKEVKIIYPLTVVIAMELLKNKADLFYIFLMSDFGIWIKVYPNRFFALKLE